MKVILLADVKALGKKGDIVEVNPGYARNCLLKKNLGVEATGKNVNDLKLQKANQDKLAKQRLEEAKAFAEELKEKSVSVAMKVGEGGKLFGTVSSKEIATAAKDQLGYDLDKKKFVVDEPIKTLGTHEIKIKLHPEVTGKLQVKVVEK